MLIICLKILLGGPSIVGNFFNCANNMLKSLKGGPKEVGTMYYCWNNRIISLEGAPEKLGGVFYCENNPGQFTREEIAYALRPLTSVEFMRGLR